MSSNSKKTQSGNNENFNVEIGDKGTDDKQIFDLNKIFHIDLSYNFDLLKNLLSSIIKNQKLKDEKITELENQILDLRIANNENVDKKKEEKKTPKSILSPNKSEENGEDKSEKDLLFELKPPKRDLVLEESEQNQPIVNKIIVSI